jgi:hypothetical protein
MNQVIPRLLSRLYDHLPLFAEEGGECSVSQLSDLIAALDANSHDQAETCILLVQRLFTVLGVLDLRILAGGRWRFMSYPAVMFFVQRVKFYRVPQVLRCQVCVSHCHNSKQPKKVCPKLHTYIS